eukprot:1629943-Ditylum_brightwellii.AAC.1
MSFFLLEKERVEGYAIGRRSKVFTAQDHKDLKAFLGYNDNYLSTEGLKLKDKANMQLDYYRKMKTLQNFDTEGWVKTTIDEEKDDNVVGCVNL